jgi:hypothetical protein
MDFKMLRREMVGHIRRSFFGNGPPAFGGTDWAAFFIGSSRLALYAEFAGLSVPAGLPFFSANNRGIVQMMFHHSSGPTDAAKECF